ncbi:MAG TPA: tRNA (adenosine(37)-N6)-threonylcarbamoyltransferase complex dimerization subunit type 1 TsaB [bacterium]|jgi:tRNA threonylcarbamoyladenosine biosynthesis protein TsaB|nr:tRNA (adenosine(37)-N6)-threonylcarbamoyltransferase complex dimerization subunit type 1 TsaB [bacterium]
MKLLAMEAGGPVLSAALFEDGRPVGQAWLRAHQKPAEHLAPMVDGLLRAQGWKPLELDALACGRGPGSFTGLRCSMAFCAGWALAKEGLLLVAVPTLQAWAEAFCPADRGRALVLLDGRRSQVYRALLEREGGAWMELLKPALVDLSLALEEGSPGEGSALLSDLASLPKAGPDAARLESAALALAVGRLACGTLERGEALAPWEPDYLRRSEAELLWERLHPAAPGAA